MLFLLCSCYSPLLCSLAILSFYASLLFSPLMLFSYALPSFPLLIALPYTSTLVVTGTSDEYRKSLLRFGARKHFPQFPPTNHRSRTKVNATMLFLAWHTVNGVNRVNRMNRVNRRNRVNRMDATNSMNDINRVNRIDSMNRRHLGHTKIVQMKTPAGRAASWLLIDDGQSKHRKGCKISLGEFNLMFL